MIVTYVIFIVTVFKTRLFVNTFDTGYTKSTCTLTWNKSVLYKFEARYISISAGENTLETFQ